MAFHRRKLLDPDSYCKTYCTAAPCPEGCVAFCPESNCAEQINKSPPPPPPPLPLPPPPTSTSIILNKSPPLSLLLIASLSVLATAFLIFTCYTVYKFYTVWRKSRRRRPPQPRRPEEEEDDDSVDEEDYGTTVDHPIWHIRTVGLQPSVINAITIVKYKKSDGLVDGTDCAVCLSEFQEDVTVRLLPKCSHAFHIPCIDTWLASHTNCPMCRAGIVSSDAAPLPDAHNSGQAEESQPEAPAEARIEIEECKMDEVQPVRRSVSLDSISASMISAAVVNALSESNKQLGKGKESDVGRRSVRGMQIGSSSIERSASCSAKVFLSRHCSRNGR